MKEFEDETALLMKSALCRFEEAEQHQVGVDLHQLTCACIPDMLSCVAFLKNPEPLQA